VKWSVTGVGCSGPACGMMSGDMYLAPKVLPSPSSVVLTATSEAIQQRRLGLPFNLCNPFPPIELLWPAK
jgi:hypothetical protein